MRKPALIEGSGTASPSRTAVGIIAAILIVAALHYARDVLVPFALALLLAFILTPVVSQLERLHVKRVPAVAAVLVVVVGLIGLLAYAVTVQLIDVANALPNYRANIHAKIEALHGPRSGPVASAMNSLDTLWREVSEVPEHGVATSAPPGAAKPRPLPVEVMAPSANGIAYLGQLLGPVFGPLGTAGLVLIFAMFMLIDREQLRNRLLRLAGQAQLSTMTEALDDATARVSRYLSLQFAVNTCYGIAFGIGLHLIGLPHALLWGALAGMLRFVPYIGTIGGAALPLLMSLAVFHGWREPLLTLGLFLVLELTLANVIEPLVYGAHTGVSSISILLAAIFWAAIWGPVGLILSLPLTVCLVVLGRHLPQFEFLNVLLGDEPVLPPEARFYQRLLAMDEVEARTVVETFLQSKSLPELYDSALIPALAMAERDRHRGALDERREQYVTQAMYELIAELGEFGALKADRSRGPDGFLPPAGTKPLRILCLAAHDHADEIAAAMLAQVLERNGYQPITMPVLEHVEELLGSADALADVICVSALPPFAVGPARSLCRQIRRRLPQTRVVVCFWNDSAAPSRLNERLGEGYADSVITRLAAAVEAVRPESSPALHAHPEMPAERGPAA